MVRQLERAPDLSQMPLIVVTAAILQDRWLKPSRSWRPGRRPGWPCSVTQS